MGPVDERAETSIQSVVLVPVVFVLVFVCFHVGSLLHQGHVAEAIATRGADVSASGGISAQTQQSALEEMSRMAQELGAELVRRPTISFGRNLVEVRVMVGARGAVPFLPRTAIATVRRVQERFVTQQERE